MEDCSVKFPAGRGPAEVRRRVAEHLDAAGVTGRDDARFYVKALFIVCWFAASYGLLVFFAASWWSAGLLCLSLGFAMAGIGFNLMHDGGHGACSRHPAVNRAMALSLELLGGSSYVWRWKHNLLHHTFPNIGGVDDDLEVGPWVRLAPHQRRRWFHRYQQFYMWLLFALLPLKWYLIDIRNFRRGGVGVQRFAHRDPLERGVFVAGKILLPLWALGLPLLRHSPWSVLAAYCGSFFTTGIILSITFLLAHCVEGAQCAPLASTGRVDTEWAVHQVQTAVDFAPGNRVLSWYLGGLNYQIEHHLFPQISHVHYPAIAPLVREACAALGVRYEVCPTLRGALGAHYRWLQRMGASTDPARPA